MLQFILGKPSSGKTYTILNKIKEVAEKGEQSVLIVPEQFTFESERAVLKAVGDKAALNVSVLSFSRLCDEIGNITGGISGRVLDDADKIIFMHRALAQVESELMLWGKYSKNVAFSSTILDTVGEFKINAISPDEIRRASEKVSSAILKAKLHDIALIYETYDMITGERFIDPADRLTKLYRDLQGSDYFKGKTVFLDSFKGFTGQQFHIIERIFEAAKDLFVSFTDNTEIKKEYSIYTNIRSAAERIKELAKRHSISIAEPIILNETRYESENLKRLERLLSCGYAEKCENDGAITVCYANTAFDEAEFAARTIRKLVRTENYRYRDFVIIARDADSYSEAVSSACDKFGVSLFYDKRIPLSSLPISVAVTSAIGAMKLSTESILRFHKSGLGTLDLKEISDLENYTYLWNIDGKNWANEWEMDTRGFVADTDKSEEAEETLKRINELRQKAIAPLLKFKQNFTTNAENMAKAIINLLKDCFVTEKLSAMCEKVNDGALPFSEDALSQGYNQYMSILDSLVNSFGDVSIDTAQFIDALEIAVNSATVGIIPQYLDQVTFGSADRIRPSRPKVAFILGANQGLFPKVVSNAGLFNISERKVLIDNQLKIADNSIYSSIDEEYLVYCNLCCPSQKLYISCHSSGLSGEKSEKSAFLETLSEKLDCIKVSEPENSLSEYNMPETDAAAFTEFCRRINNDKSSAAAIAEAVKGSAQTSKTDLIKELIAESKKEISPDTAKALYGKNLYMSATKFDTFNRCKFSYFCRYGLKAQKLQPADFDVLQRGTIVHFVLEKIVSENKEELNVLSPKELDSLTDKYINEYLDSVSGFRSVENARTRFLISRVSRSLKEVVRHLALELSQSDFKPTACELKIGIDGIPLEFPIDGGAVKINGSIDRVDEWNGYIRIIDYKTGSKSFKLPDILFGLNMQMLLYLYAVTRGNDLPDNAAAGILYMPSRRDTAGKGMAMNGLLKADETLVQAMDKQMQGEFVPKLKFNKDGSLSKTNASFIDEDKFSEIFDYIERLIKKTGNTVLSGDIDISPVDGRESAACTYCDFAGICGIEDKEPFRVPDLKADEVFEAMKEVGE